MLKKLAQLRVSLLQDGNEKVRLGKFAMEPSLARVTFYCPIFMR